MRISDWSSDVCSSDLVDVAIVALQRDEYGVGAAEILVVLQEGLHVRMLLRHHLQPAGTRLELRGLPAEDHRDQQQRQQGRSEEHMSELQSLMRISYAGLCLKKKKSEQMSHSQDRHQIT